MFVGFNLVIIVLIIELLIYLPSLEELRRCLGCLWQKHSSLAEERSQQGAWACQVGTIQQWCHHEGLYRSRQGGLTAYQLPIHWTKQTQHLGLFVVRMKFVLT